jgi:hypothetical protein
MNLLRVPIWRLCCSPHFSAAVLLDSTSARSRRFLHPSCDTFVRLRTTA